MEKIAKIIAFVIFMIVVIVLSTLFKEKFPVPPEITQAEKLIEQADEALDDIDPNYDILGDVKG